MNGIHRHREAALGRPFAAELDHAVDLPQRALVDRAQRLQLGDVPGLRQPCDRLADLADRRPCNENSAVSITASSPR